MKPGREAELDAGQENGVYWNSSREAAALFYSGGPQGASPARSVPDARPSCGPSSQERIDGTCSESPLNAVDPGPYNIYD